MSCITTFSTKLFTLAIAPFLLISVGIPYEFAMVSDMYIILSLRKEVWGDRYAHLAAHSLKDLNKIVALSLILLL